MKVDNSGLVDSKLCVFDHRRKQHCKIETLETTCGELSGSPSIEAVDLNGSKRSFVCSSVC